MRMRRRWRGVRLVRRWLRDWTGRGRGPDALQDVGAQRPESRLESCRPRAKVWTQRGHCGRAGEQPGRPHGEHLHRARDARMMDLLGYPLRQPLIGELAHPLPVFATTEM